MLTLLYFILILGVIVLVHEFGHFLFAKIFGIYVYEFSIGMGPRLWHHKKKGGETDYSIRLLPIGGYCALAGEDPTEESDVPKDRMLNHKPVWQRFIVMVAGATFNFLLALVILFAIAIFWGAPTTDPVLTGVEDGMPAQVAGLEAGDYIQKVNGKKTSTIDDVSVYIQLADKSKPVEFQVKKQNGEIKTISVTALKEEIDGVTTYRLGVAFESQIRHSVGAVFEYTFVKMGSLFKQMFITVEGLFTGDIGLNQLSGPVGIYSIVNYCISTSFFKDPFAIVHGIINILFGILIIETPSIITAFSLTFMFALILLFYGTEKIAFLQKLKYFNITNTGAYTFSGVINIILAIIFFILPLTSTIAINYIIAFYLIVDGITLFIEAINMKKIN